MNAALRQLAEVSTSASKHCPFCGYPKRPASKTCAACKDLPALDPTFPANGGTTS